MPFSSPLTLLILLLLILLLPSTPHCTVTPHQYPISRNYQTNLNIVDPIPYRAVPIITPPSEACPTILVAHPRPSSTPVRHLQTLTDQLPVERLLSVKI